METYSVGSDGRLISSVFVMSTPNRNGWVRADIYFHRFTVLKMNSGRYNIASPSFSCLGRDWTVEVDGFITGKLLIRLQPRRYENIVAGISINNVSYWKDGGELSIKGEDMLGNLEEGAMWIEVRMRMTKCSFIPDSSACRTLHGMFMDKESADVVFKIKGDQTTSFYAHRLILRHAAPQLADLCVMEGSPSFVDIPGISPAAFEVLLLYIYGGKKSNFGGDIAQVKEIIEAADKFAVTNLKLDAEIWYVSMTTITTQNVLEHLEYAESKNCSLLKETALDFFVEDFSVNCALVVNNAVEISAAVERRGRNGGELWSLSLCDLRRRALKKGLDIDGSRAMLVSALESDDSD